MRPFLCAALYGVARAGPQPRGCEVAAGSFRQRTLPALAAVLVMAAGCANDPTLGTSGIDITLSAETTGTESTSVEITGLPAEYLNSLESAKLTDDRWTELFRVTVSHEDDESGSALPAVLGSHIIDETGVLRFTPMFPFDPGRSYAVRFDPGRLSEFVETNLTATDAVVTLPKPDILPTTVVEHVFPSGDRMPENQLKLYLHFSAPMSHVDGLEYLSLRDSRGREVEAPFLPFGAEFWDTDHVRYTVFFDPGRVKQGLELNERLGRPLQAGESYSLVIDPAWPDAQGNPLKTPFEKHFSVGSADTIPLAQDAWRLRVPASGSTQRLVVSFPEPLDHALMTRAIGVQDDAGRPVEGTVETGNWETRWMMTPSRPWTPGTYTLVASPVLEDLAGNRIGTPFEVNAFERVNSAPAEDAIHIPFEIR